MCSHSWRLFALSLILMWSWGSAQAQQAMTDGAPVSLGNGEQRVLTFPLPLTKVATADPTIAAVLVSGEREILVTGLAEGATVLSVWQRGDARPLQAPVLVARTQGSKVPFGTQVQTDIRIIEVNRTELNSLGVYYARLFNGGDNAFGISPGGGGFRGFGGGGSAAAPLAGEGFNLFSFGANSLSIINALERGGFAYTLAEPSLTSLSGQSATFLSGGEFPIPVGADEDSIEIEFKQFGISLNLTPTVIDQGQIILRVAPEVSELDFASGVETAGVAVPGLRVRRTETTVSMAPGETFILSGLVSRHTINNSDRVPGLGSIPILGALFRSDRIAREDRELIMVVTPHLVQPVAAERPAPPRMGLDYHHSSMGWLDMVVEPRKGSQPVRHGLSW